MTVNLVASADPSDEDVVFFSPAEGAMQGAQHKFQITEIQGVGSGTF